MKRVSVSNVLAVLGALWVGATCASSCTSRPEPPRPSVNRRIGQQPTYLRYVDLQPFVPQGIHRGIYDDMARCLRVKGDADDVQWATARYLVSVEYRLLVYGSVGDVTYPDGHEVFSIVLDADFVYHPTVIAHEAVHALARVADGDWRLEACTLYVPPPLPYRPVPQAVLDLVQGGTP